MNELRRKWLCPLHLHMNNFRSNVYFNYCASHSAKMLHQMNGHWNGSIHNIHKKFKPYDCVNIDEH